MKTVMAVTGLIFVAFILAHMYGNFMIFAGEEAFDEYAHHLRTFGTPMLPEEGFLWLLRITLVVALVLHVWAMAILWARARAARTKRYAVNRHARGLFFAKAMRWGGVALFFFVIFHLLHFTTNTIQVNGDFASPAARLVSSFEVWWAVLIYLLAIIALALHLWHGVFAAAMTLGWNTSVEASERIRLVAITIAVVTFVGFMVPPFAILFGLIP